MNTYRVFLGLGSNVGDRHRFMQRALMEVNLLPGLNIVWTSGVYESDPYGKIDQPKFLNACVEVETALSPPELLVHLKEVEQRIGRSTSERWGPREIDIDILVYDGVVYTDEQVTVPHPDLEQRRFVLVPLKEIAADLVHPVSGLTVEELAAVCADHGAIKATSYHLLIP
jgi:2-amino-4-hydroxy-6-hydroxymethyldihydropteridine diphosphokinase